MLLAQIFYPSSTKKKFPIPFFRLLSSPPFPFPSDTIFFFTLSDRGTDLGFLFLGSSLSSPFIQFHLLVPLRWMGPRGTMRALVDPPATVGAAVAEETEKEKKSRRRQSRRSKQNSAVTISGMYGSVDSAFGEQTQSRSGIMGAGPVGLPPKASGVSFSSLPTTFVNGECSAAAGPSSVSADDSAVSRGISRSCPSPNSGTPKESYSDVVSRPCTSKKYFDPHWSEQAVVEAIEKGRAFKAKFRVNAYNRLEAYCTIEGLPIDILINGATPQNRAIEGDVVAVMLEPVAQWTKLKGSSAFNSPLKLAGLNVVTEVQEEVGCNYTMKQLADSITETSNYRGQQIQLENDYHEKNSVVEAFIDDAVRSFGKKSSGFYSTTQHSPSASCHPEKAEAMRSLERICSAISSNQGRRPTGRVLSIITSSSQREAIVGFLSVNFEMEGTCKRGSTKILKKNLELAYLPEKGFVQLVPTDPKFPKMILAVEDLPDCVKCMLKDGDVGVERSLVAAQIDEWNEDSLYPKGHLIRIFGRGGEIEPHIGAILFENAISNAGFSSESLSCLPDVPWEVPEEELRTRRDLRTTCTVTIDPSAASDLDDALSVEWLSDNTLRIGVHIADVSYFVLPDTALDAEAQTRSTSVYILKHRLPMLPPRLSEEVGSLVPGVDRLAFSIIWDFDSSGNIINRWIGRSVIKSCCKLSYDYVQDIINGAFKITGVHLTENLVPQVHGNFEIKDVIESLGVLYEISKMLRETRFRAGALSLESAKLMFLFDENGIPYDSYLDERKESCSVVEEFMLLANRSIAEVISKAFPDCALLRRHPEPNSRKLKEFESFCSKHGFELEISSSGRFHSSLSKIRENLKNDPVLFDILVSYASKPMQCAAYFCTGDLRGNENDWAHYALSVPFYTHFTSPLRRYPDIIVHRILAAVLEAEETYLKHQVLLGKSESSDDGFSRKCFSGLYFDKDAAETEEGREALQSAALKYKIPGTEVLSEVAAHCNERKFASKHAEEAGEKLYLWVLLKNKEVLVSEARVMALGPRFVTVYVNHLGFERRIYYDEVEGLTVEWLDSTCTLVLDIPRNKRATKRNNQGKFRTIEDVALLVNTYEVSVWNERDQETASGSSVCTSTPLGLGKKRVADPACFPLVLQHLSTIPVALHAIGGHDGPVDIAARLYACSYFK